MIVLLAAGAGVTFLGLLAVLFGLPISDTSFGNALLIGGVVVLCTGLLILAMWFVGRQLERIAALLGEGAGALPRSVASSPAIRDSVVAPNAPLFPVPDLATDRLADNDAEPAAEALFPPPEVVPEPPAAPPEKPRRNLMFETRRRDKPDVAPDVKPIEPPKRGDEPAKPSFDDAWSGGPPNLPRALQPDAVPAPAASNAPSVTVIKSGVVDGMAYSLYSDGSIEAQMPAEGLIRFASLDALRDYLEQRP